ncbi:hypothetical protein TcWFU_006613 [Taenia crassiceps]|uniref:Uncharacterized protein n=1 Tax=Taenia crassiceps TaxID=6207 RepID=A0ABR4Q0V8_9CEST
MQPVCATLEADLARLQEQELFSPIGNYEEDQSQPFSDANRIRLGRELPRGWTRLKGNKDLMNEMALVL